MRLGALLVAATALGSAACTHSLTVKGEAKDARVIVDGKDIGVPSAEGTAVDVRRGPGPIPYEVHGPDGSFGEGVIERSESVWWLLALAGAGAVCCAPSAAAAGFVIANPGLFVAPLGLLTGDVGTITRSCAYPAWLTIPSMVLCGTAGLSPLGLAFVAEEPPAVVTVPGPKPKAPNEPAPAPVAMRF